MSAPGDEHVARGIAALRAGSVGDAIREFEAAVGTAGDELELADRYHWLATAQYESAEFDAATITLETALAVLADIDAAELRGRCHEGLADLALEREDAADAHHHFHAARTLLIDIDPAAAAECLLGMSTADLGVGEHGRAEDELRRALGEFEAIDHRSGIVATLDLTAEFLTESGRTQDAVTHLYRLAHLLTEAEDHAGAAEANQRLGTLLLPAVQVDEALHALHSAKSGYLRSDEPLSAAEVALKIGEVFEDLGRFEEATANFREGARLCAAHGDPDDTLWFEVNIATVALSTGDYQTAEATLTTAAATFADLDTDKGIARYAQTLRFLGALYAETSRFQLASNQYEKALALGTRVDDEEFIADCHYGLGLVATLTGRYRDGLEKLSLARATFTQLNSEQKAMLCHQSEGMCYSALGEFTAATDSLLAARTMATTYGMALQRAFTDIHLGLVLTETGRFDDAEQTLLGAREVLVSSGLADRVVETDGNIAGLYLKQGRYADAAASYRRSAAQLRARGLAAKAAVCTQNEGTALMMLGESATSAAAFDRAGAYFAADPDYRANLAVCHRSRALLAVQRQDLDIALAEFAAGRSLAVELGTTLEVAKCDFFVGVVLYDKDSSALSTAIDLALPAALYINSIRWQFDRATDRMSWSALYAQLQSHLFTLAVRHPDPTLLGDLIEVSLNSGTHTTAPAHALLRTTSLAAALHDIAGTTQTAVDARIHGGAATLVAGSALPMAPPPRLRLPDGRIALAPYFAAAANRYGLTDPAHEVRAW
ncbi:tetratricopeptide repeat protein [Nocardia caishijiensis]|uniref:Tetratricopeptide repeat protein n=1 Tax=Nocardia caishijiensis TaxID=184756 RepID=A0ABQ6YHV4_9NOCA|nr:tetratricopeptide repeat protein [Nocardia caishijiensis]KAF0845286.1 tetratricopeptide repeat protein [Nocardia caishijiensis]